MLNGIITALPLAATESAQDKSSNFLVSPDVGLMLWTLLVFLVTLFLLRKYAFPPIKEALEKRQHLIEESIDSAQRTKDEAEEILLEYRERLKEARVQAEEIVARARKAGETTERQSIEDARGAREELMEQTRRDIEAETRRAIQEIRKEVADLTVAAPDLVTHKSLNGELQPSVVEEALSALRFSAVGEGR